jgi:multidrug efflux pump
MAITIMGGLFVATFLTLLFLPGLYALWYRKRLDERGQAGEPLGELGAALPDDAASKRPVPIAIAAE